MIVREEMEIDVAYALEDVPAVAGVYAIDPRAGDADDRGYELAVVLSPIRGLTISEVHYRLLTVLTHEECGLVLFVDANAHPPLVMARARRISISEGARHEATLRALARVERVAARHDEEEEEVRTHRAVKPLDVGRAFEDAVDVAVALHEDDHVRSVHLIGHQVDGEKRVDVFVELGALTSAQILGAHRAILDAAIPIGAKRVLYGDATMRILRAGPRVRVTPYDRLCAAKRARSRATWRPLTLPAAPTSAALEELLRKRLVQAPIAVSMESSSADVVATLASPRRPHVLVIHEDASVAAPLGALGAEVQVTQVGDGWAACDLLREGTFDLVLSGVRVGDLRGTQVYKMAVAVDPSFATRFFFLASRATLDAARPSSGLARVLATPIRPDDIVRLLATLPQLA